MNTKILCHEKCRWIFSCFPCQWGQKNWAWDKSSLSIPGTCANHFTSLKHSFCIDKNGNNTTQLVGIKCNSGLECRISWNTQNIPVVEGLGWLRTAGRAWRVGRTRRLGGCSQNMSSEVVGTPDWSRIREVSNRNSGQVSVKNTSLDN